MTVNCPNCGGPISVTDDYCPYCGSLNQTKEKEKIKKVETKVKLVQGKASLNRPLMVIIVLIVLNLIAAGFAGSAYSMGLDKQRAMNETRSDEIVSQFKGYLEDRDYLLAYSMYESGDYYSLSSMKQYRMVTDALGDYSSIFFHVAPALPSKYNTDDLLNYVSSVGSSLAQIYEYPHKEYYDYVPSQEVLDTTEDIICEAEALVCAAYHLTDEERSQLRDMKEDNMVDLLKKAYLRYESEHMDSYQEEE